MAEKMNEADELRLDEKDRRNAEERRRYTDYEKEYKVADLPPVTIRTYDRVGNPVVYIVHSKYNSGGSGNIYLVHKESAPGKEYMLKEFCPENTHRNIRTNLLQIDYKCHKESLVNFKKEPERIIELLNNIENIKDPHERELMRSNLNLVIPDTPAFQYFGSRKGEGNWYFVMEKAPGENLSDFIKRMCRKGRYQLMPLDKKLILMEEIVKAVQNMHSIGCVHKDIKPDNIHVFYSNPEQWEGLTLTLLDYGLATDLGLKTGARRSTYMSKAGTQGYCELFLQNGIYYESWFKHPNFTYRNQVKLLDIYSLGCVLNFLCLSTHKLVLGQRSVNTSFVNEASDNMVVVEKAKLDDPSLDRLTRKKLQMVHQLVIDTTSNTPEERAKLFSGQPEYTDVMLQRIRDIRNCQLSPMPTKKIALGAALAIAVLGFALWQLTRTPVQSLTLNKQDIVLAVGESFQLNCDLKPDDADNKTVSWHNSLNGVIRLKDGKVTGLAGGTDNVIVTAHNGVADTCHVKVDPDKLLDLEFVKDRLELKVGETKELKMNKIPATAKEDGLRYDSNNSVNIDYGKAQNGRIFRITGVKPGQFWFECSHWQGGRDSCLIVVQP